MWKLLLQHKSLKSQINHFGLACETLSPTHKQFNPPLCSWAAFLYRLPVTLMGRVTSLLSIHVFPHANQTASEACLKSIMLNVSLRLE